MTEPATSAPWFASVEAAGEVQRVRGIGREEFETTYLRTGLPLVIERSALGWPAIGRWTLDFWRQERGSSNLVATTRDARGRVGSVELTVRDYLDLLHSPDYDPSVQQVFLANWSLGERWPDLVEDIRGVDLIEEADVKQIVVFFGRNSVSPCHFHPRSQAIVAQISGTKRFLLYSPDQTARLHPHPWYSGSYNYSRVHFADPDRARHPRFIRARGLRATIEPGDLLFIPLHWWHYVEGFDVSLSLTFFFRSRPRHWHLHPAAWRSAAHALFHRLRPHTGILRRLRESRR